MSWLNFQKNRKFLFVSHGPSPNYQIIMFMEHFSWIHVWHFSFRVDLRLYFQLSPVRKVFRIMPDKLFCWNRSSSSMKNNRATTVKNRSPFRVHSDYFHIESGENIRQKNRKPGSEKNLPLSSLHWRRFMSVSTGRIMFKSKRTLAFIHQIPPRPIRSKFPYYWFSFFSPVFPLRFLIKTCCKTTSYWERWNSLCLPPQLLPNLTITHKQNTKITTRTIQSQEGLNLIDRPVI